MFMLKFSRIILHLGLFLPFLWLLTTISGNNDSLGADPIKEIQHFLGFTALTLLIFVFLLRISLEILALNRFKILHRALGLWAFFYTVMHILSYVVLELNLDITLFLSELINRYYLLIGALSFVILCAVTISSIPAIQRKLGKFWLNLHKLSYIALLLGGVHYFLSTKAVEFMAIVYLVIIGILLIIITYKKVAK